MLKIAICDDEINVCSQLEESLETYLKKHMVKAEIQVFYAGDYLCRYLTHREPADLIFLDIGLPGMDGVQLGVYIRNILEDEVTDLVYISSKTGYAMELFQCRPIDFLIKPLTYQRVEQVMDVIIKRNSVRSRTFEFQKDGISQKIPLKEIMYFKSNNKQIHIITCSGGEKVFYGKLGKIAGCLPDSVFLLIHKSFFINCDYVEEYRYEWVKMINGDLLPISKAHRKTVREKLAQKDLQEG